MAIIRGNNSGNILVGTRNADQIYGFGGNDKLWGKDGDDELFGGSGRDQLYGARGDDRLFGEDGDDRLDSGSGRDLLDGGGGNDTLLVANLDFERAEGGAGDDRLVLGTVGATLDLTAIASGKVAGIERIDLNGGGNELVIGSQELLTLSDSSDRLIVYGGSTDRVTSSESWTTAGSDSHRSRSRHPRSTSWTARTALSSMASAPTIFRAGRSALPAISTATADLTC